MKGILTYTIVRLPSGQKRQPLAKGWHCFLHKIGAAVSVVYVGQVWPQKQSTWKDSMQNQTHALNKQWR